MNKYTKADLEMFYACGHENNRGCSRYFLGNSDGPFCITACNILELFRAMMSTIQTSRYCVQFDIIAHPYVVSRIKISDVIIDGKLRELHGDYCCSLNYYFTGDVYYNPNVIIVPSENSLSGLNVYSLFCVANIPNKEPLDISVAMVRVE